MLQEPAAFATAVQGLLQAQRQALAVGSQAGGEHLCFLGSGRQEEDRYTHMVVASFLQKHTQYVSMVAMGYQGSLVFAMSIAEVLILSVRIYFLISVIILQRSTSTSATKSSRIWSIIIRNIV